MKYGSVCSGIEAATVAWHPLGWEPTFFSEIEKFPSAVLKHHYPNVPNLGDMTKYKEWPSEPFDLLVGGTPCQSFSVAGLRKGLADPRGNLMLTYRAILQRYLPRWMVWENVPGVLSSNGGRDFAAFLRTLEELGYGWAYRILDAQYFGVAQRRRRVFVVGYLGDWRRAAAVLFERESLSGHPAPSREKRQGAAGSTTLGFTKRCGFGYSTHENGVNTLDRGQNIHMVCMAHGQANAEIASERSPALTCNHEAPIACFNAEARPDEMKFDMHTLTASQTAAVATRRQVRRLTPTECERLQGFPDGYTDIKNPTPDGPRYKALGNSMAVPVMRWIGQRIQLIESLKEDIK